MQRVITINLNGNAYQLDESAYDGLRAYLGRAEEQLAANPDRAEIIADLEQAIADKCRRFLGPSKTVVSSTEIDEIVKEMGPVEGTPAGSGPPHEAGAGSGTGPAGGARKRFYQIREGAMLSGLCNGLAAYFDLDVTVVRIIFLALAFVTKGVWIIAYVVFAFIIPFARTPEEHAEAHGRPFNAQELIDRAKKSYASLKNGKAWRRQWRRQQRQWRHERRRARNERRWMSWSPQPPQMAAGYGAQVWAGLMVPLFGIVGAAFFVALVFSVVSLVNTGELFGWALPPGTPLWAGVLVVVILYHVLASPIRAARHAALYAYGRNFYSWVTFWDGTVWVGLLAFFGWLLYTHMPDVHNVREFIDNVPDALRSLGGR